MEGGGGGCLFFPDYFSFCLISLHYYMEPNQKQGSEIGKSQFIMNSMEVASETQLLFAEAGVHCTTSKQQ